MDHSDDVIFHEFISKVEEKTKFQSFPLLPPSPLRSVVFRIVLLEAPAVARPSEGGNGAELLKKGKYIRTNIFYDIWPFLI